MLFFFFKQKTAYERRISDWSSDVCSSDLTLRRDPGVSRGSREGPSGDLPLRRLAPGHHQVAERVGVEAGDRPVDHLSPLLQDRDPPGHRHHIRPDRKSVGSGKSVSVRVDLGGRRTIKKTYTT